ncbi:hypothetical protein HK100_012460 [Physocladia obscura]|uniref:Uncharacterized protein n=1 Tax=Physocladia obscura TaxID=109957 RepID=A0AAD5T2I1_9FUNG|nr:hypothetical protein HK100_012460 [Physocladia obscura]
MRSLEALISEQNAKLQDKNEEIQALANKENETVVIIRELHSKLDTNENMLMNRSKFCVELENNLLSVQTDFKTLQSLVEARDLKIRDFEDSIQQLSLQVKSGIEELQKKNNDATVLREEIVVKAEKIKSLELTVSSQNNILKDYELRLSNLNTEKIAISEDLLAKSQEVSILAADLKVTKNLFSDKDTTSKDFVLQLSTYQSSIKNFEASILEKDLKIRNVEKTLKSEKKRSADEIEQLHAKISTLKAEVTSNEGIIISLRDSVFEKETLDRRQHEDISKLESDLYSLQEKVAKLQNLLSKKEEESSQLSENLALLDLDTQSLQNTLVEKCQKLAQLEEMMGLFSDEKNSFIGQIEISETKIKSLNEEVLKMSSLQAENALHQSNLLEYKSKIQFLEVSLSEKTTVVEILEQNLVNINSKFEIFSQDSANKISSIEVKLKAAASKLEFKELECKELTKSFEQNFCTLEKEKLAHENQSQVYIKQLNFAIKELETRCKSKEEEFSKIEQKFNQIVEENRTMVEEMKIDNITATISLESKVLELESELGKSRSEFHSIQRAYKLLESSSRASLNELETCSSECSRLRDLNDKLKLEIQLMYIESDPFKKLKQENENLEKLYSLSKNENIEPQAQIDTKNGEFLGLQESSASVQYNLSKEDISNQKMLEKIQLLKLENVDLQHNFNSLDSEHRSLIESRENLWSNLNAKMHELKQLRGEKTLADNSNAKLAADLKIALDKQSSIPQLKADKLAAEESLIQLENNHQELKKLFDSTISNFQREKVLLSETIAIHLIAIDDLRVEVSSLTEQLSLRKLESEESINIIKGENDWIREELSRSNKQIYDLEASFELVSVNLEKTTAELQIVVDQKDMAEGSVSKLHGEIKLLKLENEFIKKERDRFYTDLNCLSEICKNNDTMATEYAKFVSLLDAKNSEILSIQSLLNENSFEVNRLQNLLEITAASNETNLLRLTNDLNEAQSKNRTISLLQINFEQMQVKTKVLEEKLESVEHLKSKTEVHVSELQSELLSLRENNEILSKKMNNQSLELLVESDKTVVPAQEQKNSIDKAPVSYFAFEKNCAVEIETEASSNLLLVEQQKTEALATELSSLRESKNSLILKLESKILQLIEVENGLKLKIETMAAEKQLKESFEKKFPEYNEVTPKLPIPISSSINESDLIDLNFSIQCFETDKVPTIFVKNNDLNSAITRLISASTRKIEEEWNELKTLRAELSNLLKIKENLGNFRIITEIKKSFQKIERLNTQFELSKKDNFNLKSMLKERELSVLTECEKSRQLKINIDFLESSLEKINSEWNIKYHNLEVKASELETEYKKSQLENSHLITPANSFEIVTNHSDFRRSICVQTVGLIDLAPVFLQMNQISQTDFVEYLKDETTPVENNVILDLISEVSQAKCQIEALEQENSEIQKENARLDNIIQTQNKEAMKIIGDLNIERSFKAFALSKSQGLRNKILEMQQVKDSEIERRYGIDTISSLFELFRKFITAQYSLMQLMEGKLASVITENNELKAVNIQHDMLLTESDKLRAACDNWSQSYNELRLSANDDIQSKVAEISNLKNFIESMRNNQTHLLEAMDLVKESDDFHRIKCNELKTIISESSVKNKNLNNEITRLKEERDSFELKFNESEKRTNQLSKEWDDSFVQLRQFFLTEKEAMLQEHKLKIFKLEEKLKAETLTSKNFNSTADALKVDYEDAKSSLAAAESRIAQIQEDAKKANKKLRQSLEKETMNLRLEKKKADSLHSIIQLDRDKNLKLSNQCEELQIRIQAMTESLNILSTSENDQKKKSEFLQTQLDTANNEINLLKRQMELKAKHYMESENYLRKKLKDSRDEVHQKEMQLIAAQSYFARQKVSVFENADSNSTELSKLITEKKEIEAKLKALEDIFALKSAELECCKIEYANQLKNERDTVKQRDEQIAKLLSDTENERIERIRAYTLQQKDIIVLQDELSTGKLAESRLQERLVLFEAEYRTSTLEWDEDRRLLEEELANINSASNQKIYILETSNQELHMRIQEQESRWRLLENNLLTRLSQESEDLEKAATEIFRLNSVIKSLEYEVSTMLMRKNGLESELEHMEKVLSIDQQNFDRLIQETTDLRFQLAAAQDYIQIFEQKSTAVIKSRQAFDRHKLHFEVEDLIKLSKTVSIATQTVEPLDIIAKSIEFDHLPGNAGKKTVTFSDSVTEEEYESDTLYFYGQKSELDRIAKEIHGIQEKHVHSKDKNKEVLKAFYNRSHSCQ